VPLLRSGCGVPPGVSLVLWRCVESLEDCAGLWSLCGDIFEVIESFVRYRMECESCLVVSRCCCLARKSAGSCANRTNTEVVGELFARETSNLNIFRRRLVHEHHTPELISLTHNIPGNEITLEDNFKSTARYSRPIYPRARLIRAIPSPGLISQFPLCTRAYQPPTARYRIKRL
jgi:hypothetical protein